MVLFFPLIDLAFDRSLDGFSNISPRLIGIAGQDSYNEFLGATSFVGVEPEVA
jgi:hypothetical protein